jgi:hypothetical protein
MPQQQQPKHIKTKIKITEKEETKQTVQTQHEY